MANIVPSGLMFQGSPIELVTSAYSSQPSAYVKISSDYNEVDWNTIYEGFTLKDTYMYLNNLIHKNKTSPEFYTTDIHDNDYWDYVKLEIGTTGKTIQDTYYFSTLNINLKEEDWFNYKANKFGKYTYGFEPINGENMILNGDCIHSGLTPMLYDSVFTKNNFSLSWTPNQYMSVRQPIFGPDTYMYWTLSGASNQFKYGDTIQIEFDYYRVYLGNGVNHNDGEMFSFTLTNYSGNTYYISQPIKYYPNTTSAQRDKWISHKLTYTIDNSLIDTIRFGFENVPRYAGDNATFRLRNFKICKTNNVSNYINKFTSSPLDLIYEKDLNVATYTSAINNNMKKLDYVFNNLNQFYTSQYQLTDNVRMKKILRYAPTTLSFMFQQYFDENSPYIKYYDCDKVYIGSIYENITRASENYAFKHIVHEKSSSYYQSYTFLNSLYKYIEVELNPSRSWNEEPDINMVATRKFFFEIVDDDKSINKYQVYYENRRGVMDWIVMDCTSTKQINVKDNYYKKNWRGYTAGDAAITSNLSKITDVRYAIESTDVYDLQSNFIDETDYMMLEELITSPQVYLYDPKYDQIYSMIVKDNNFKYKKYRTDSIFNFQLKLEKQINNVR